MYGKKYISLIFIALLLITCKAFAEPIITISDTTIPRGSIYKIPIYGNFNSLDSKSLELVFEFNQFVIDIKNAEIDQSSILSGKTISITQDLFHSPAICRVKIDPTNLKLQDGKLFDLSIEGLVANDTITDFKCTELKIDGKNINYTSKNSTIIVPGELITQEYPEGLYQNYPSPFRGSTTFNFNVGKESAVEFELFNYFGTRLYNYDELSKYIKIFSISKENGTKQINNIKSALTKGKYSMQFTADESVFPSGMYILTMKANNQFFSKSFIYVK